MKFILSGFTNEKGDSVFSADANFSIQPFKHIKLNPLLREKLTELIKKYEQILVELKKSGMDRYTQISEWPEGLREQRTIIFKEFQHHFSEILNLLKGIEYFYENEVSLVGASVSDQFSFRADYYITNLDYHKNLSYLRNFMSENELNRAGFSADNLVSIERYVTFLVAPLIVRAQPSFLENTRILLNNKVKSIY